MRPVIQKIFLLGLLSFSVIGLTGCGEKRIHVATVSGAPGEQSDSSTSEALESLSSDSAGLPGTSVDESSLSGGNSSTEEVRADAVLPVAPIEPLDFAHEPSMPAYSDEPSMPANSDEPSMPEPQLSLDTPSEPESGPDLAGDPGSLTPFANGKEIETQSGSSTPNDSPRGQVEASQDEMDTFSGGSQMASAEEPSGAFQDDQTDPQSDISDPSPDFFQNDPLNPQIMEQIPERVQMAKAEPSDILRQQLDKIKEEELATASAGLEDVFFQYDSWTLTAEAKESLERDMGWLANDPSSSLIIEGHADQRGTQAYNMILGKKRAMAIRDYLSQLGVDPSRLSVISYGKDKPFCQDLTEVCHQLNRRGHLLVQN
jgi:outer membrane protein OmpA-like peptidoglycan-associated protein